MRSVDRIRICWCSCRTWGNSAKESDSCWSGGQSRRTAWLGVQVPCMEAEAVKMSNRMSAEVKRWRDQSKRNERDGNLSSLAGTARCGRCAFGFRSGKDIDACLKAVHLLEYIELGCVNRDWLSASLAKFSVGIHERCAMAPAVL